MNYGFIRKALWSFSHKSLPKIVLQSNGRWDAFLPEYEPQFGAGWDTFACSVWGTLNALEILDRRLFNKQSNYSERYIANAVPVRDPGNDPFRVAKAIGEVYGVVDEKLYPMTETYEAFIYTTPPSERLLAEGKKWLDEFSFETASLWTGNLTQEEKKAILKEHLKYSPIGVSVTSWSADGDVYVDYGNPNNHWCILVGYTNDGRDLRMIFDSYDQTIKLLADDHIIEHAAMYHLEKKKKKVFLWTTFLSKFMTRGIINSA